MSTTSQPVPESPPASAERESDSPEKGLPPKAKLVVRLLDRFGAPTVLLLGVAAAFWYWSDRTAKERAADRQATTAALGRIWGEVAASRRACERAELVVRWENPEGSRRVPEPEPPPAPAPEEP